MGMASTRQTINTFFERAASREFARDFLFRLVNITFAGGATFNESELVYVRSASLPARQITNVVAPYMGLDFNLDGSVKYPGSDAWSVNMYCDAESDLRTKFLDESRRIFDEQTSTGDYGVPTRGSVITLVQLDKALDPVNTYKLVGASVRNTGELSYNIAEGVGNVLNFETTMSYHFFEQEENQ
tara:strand:- start:45055 stop:45609 length:555 start_codon:yes stop_codon:yes gene_type:complete